ncbi:MAG: hypothetical protein MUF51_03020, partial [Vicinamibacteria bacterium]|nr:hypothetical protein [Vicinamibacteria bacterium]
MNWGECRSKASSAWALVSVCGFAVVCLGLTLAAAPLMALDPDKSPREYIVRSWTEEDGLPHRTILRVIQTRDGYLWIGSQGGLARFDGARFTVFNATNTRIMTENSIRALAESADGTLWIAPLRSDLLTMTNGRIESRPDLLPAVWRNDGLRDIFTDSRGTLWLTTGEGIGRVGQDGRLMVLAPAVMPRDLTFLRHRMVEGPDGRIWVAAADGLRCVQGDIVTTTPISAPTRGLHVTRDGTLWIGIDGLGLGRMRDGRLSLVALPIVGAQGSLRITAIHSDRHDNLWVGTNWGLYRVQPQRGDAAVMVLPEAEVEDLIEDERGNLWVASYEGLVELSDPPFRAFAAADGPQEIWTAVEDEQGAIWMASAQPPYLQFVKDGVAHAAPGRYPAGVQAVWSDASGRMLAGGRDGLYAWQGQEWRPVPNAPRVDVVAITQDAERTLWLADANGEVHKFAGDHSRTFGRLQGLPGSRIEGIYATRDLSVWVATHTGVFRIQNDLVAEQVLGEDAAWRYVRHVREDEDGALWFGTRAGLACLRAGRVLNFGARQGLPDPIVHSIVDDLAGRLWVGCSKGIYSVAKADLERLARGQ